MDLRLLRVCQTTSITIIMRIATDPMHAPITVPRFIEEEEVDEAAAPGCFVESFVASGTGASAGEEIGMGVGSIGSVVTGEDGTGLVSVI